MRNGVVSSDHLSASIPRRFQCKRQVLGDVLFLDLLRGVQLDMPPSFSSAFKVPVRVDDAGAVAQLQRDVLLVREDATERDVSGEEDAAVLHFLGYGGNDGFHQRANGRDKRVLLIAKQADVIQKCINGLGRHDVAFALVGPGRSADVRESLVTRFDIPDRGHRARSGNRGVTPATLPAPPPVRLG